MDRESLKPLVEAQLGESRLTVLSPETIDEELDAVLREEITDDAQVDDAFAKRIADRLLRMNGNVAKNAGRQITEYKNRHPQPTPPAPPKAPAEGKADPEIEKIREQLAELQESLKKREAKAANDAVVAEVREAFTKKFSEAKIQPRDYFVGQVFGKFKLPVLGEGEQYDIKKLADDCVENYYGELKAAGIRYERPRKGGSGGGNDTPSKDALSRREAYKAKMRSRGLLPAEKKE